MPTIYAASTDGFVRKYQFSGPTWASIRDASSGTISSPSAVASSLAIRVVGSTSRGGLYDVGRSFFAFDTSGITATVASATISFFGYINNSSNIIGVKATKPDLSTNIATADFQAITGFSAGSSMNGNVTDYTAEYSGTWSTSGYNSITLNAAALGDLQNDSVFAICLVDYDYDYLNQDPGTSLSRNTGLHYTNYTGTSRDPKIEYTLATGYGNNVNGVAAANIGSVIGVATANIDKINGV